MKTSFPCDACAGKYPSRKIRHETIATERCLALLQIGVGDFPVFLKKNA
jgi:hypothetical protein